MLSGSTGHRLRYSWNMVAGPTHQRMVRARSEREEDSRTSRSMGVSNGRRTLGAARRCPVPEPAPNKGVHVAAEKASILRVQVPSCQWPDAGT